MVFPSRSEREEIKRERRGEREGERERERGGERRGREDRKELTITLAVRRSSNGMSLSTLAEC